MKLTTNNHSCLALALVLLASTAHSVAAKVGATRNQQEQHPKHRQLSHVDETRAYMPVPPHGSPLLSGSASSIPETLNIWMKKIHPNDKLKKCEEFDGVDELNGMLTEILELKHPRLQEIYIRNCETPEGCDNRHLDLDTVDQFQAEWEGEKQDLETCQDDQVREIMHTAATHGKCFQAVMMFHHHISADARTQLLEKQGFLSPCFRTVATRRWNCGPRISRTNQTITTPDSFTLFLHKKTTRIQGQRMVSWHVRIVT